MQDKKKLRRLFYNNRLLMIFSAFLSFIIWLTVALVFSPEDQRVLKNVPVKIEMSNSVSSFDLRVFGTDEYFVDVTVTGKRYLIGPGALKADDISVTASTNYVDAAGKYSLSIKAVPKKNNAEYTITDISADYIDVYFDVYKEGEYLLTPDIETDLKNLVTDEYYRAEPVLSENAVTISGPATEINKIKTVYARAQIKKTLTKTTTFDALIIPTGENGSRLRYLTINSGNADITLTVPVYKRAYLPVKANLLDIPSSFLTDPFTVTCSPAKVHCGLDEDMLNETSVFEIANISFSQLRAGKNVFKIKPEQITAGVVIDDVGQFTVTVEKQGLAERTFTLNKQNIIFKNIPDGLQASAAQDNVTNVIVAGLPAQLDSLKNTDIYAEVDLAGFEASDTEQQVIARLFTTNDDSCWVFGSYKVAVRLEKSS